ncbi:MAG TPA: bifunctional DNA primase/polymerase [Pirellulaceae bacterium]|nr:bifunctional DNA primase/polymerase [Pirellulaceae bacterium]
MPPKSAMRSVTTAAAASQSSAAVLIPTPQRSLLDAARGYRRWGWSVIPTRADNYKESLVPWTKYQQESAPIRDIEKWFASDATGGVAVILGPASGGLACRDFDDPAAYQSWQSKNTDLSSRLPTVKTRRGYHVYFRVAPDAMFNLRSGLKKWGVGAIVLGDGELRADHGCYTVLPPTPFPDGRYTWLIPATGSPSQVDLFTSGLLPPKVVDQVLLKVDTEDTDDAGLPRRLKPLVEPCLTARNESPNHHHHHLPAPSRAAPDGFPKQQQSNPKGSPHWTRDGQGTLKQEIDQIIARTIPTSEHTRNRQLFLLARELKSLPQYCMASPEGMEGVVREWHQRALPAIATKSWLVTWTEFKQAWKKVKHLKGREPLRMMFSQAMQRDLPKCAERFADDPQAQWLIALCRELQEAAPGKPFYLSCRAAGELVKLSHTAANTLICGLVEEEILKLVKKGDHRARQASEFRYLGD